MRTFFNEHPMVTIIVGGLIAIVGNVVGGNVMGKGMGNLVEQTARDHCEECGLDYDEYVK